MISFIIRGPVLPTTPILIQQINILFKTHETILSTWRGEEYKYKYDVWPHKLVLTEDPGNIENGNNSVNRVITGIKRGLEYAKYDYVMELRSDAIMQSYDWLLLYKDYVNLPRLGAFNLFKERMLIGNVYTVNPTKGWPLPMHPGDWFHFGLKEDLQLLFDIPLRDTTPKVFRNEQYFFLEAMKKKFNIDFIKYDEDKTDENIAITKECFRDNFVIADIPRHGIWNSKYPFVGDHENLFSHDDWLNLF